MQIPENFTNTKVLVVGDVMLDRYWWGGVNRISPEAPVPVVLHDKTTLVAGGAANVAANIAGIGAIPFLAGIVGDDDEADLFPGVMRNSGIENFKIIGIPGRRSTIKTRIIAHNQQIARLDQESANELSPADQTIVLEAVKPMLAESDAVIISDYAKGLLAADLVRALILEAKRLGKTVLVDPKGKDYAKYTGATIMTPNRREAAEACGFEFDGIDHLEESGRQLLEELSLEAILITQSEEGMTLLQRGKAVEYLSATARRVYDVTGAGDTVIAVMAVALGAGLGFVAAAEIANRAAGLVVEKVGTTPITRDILTLESTRS
jgi:D-beta-D-heptose 7-phosphate kinase / D-beta-D-heptose 1-phosphate adenosyltransferase